MMRSLPIRATIYNDKSGNLYQGLWNVKIKVVTKECMPIAHTLVVSVLCISLLQMCFELFKHNKYKMVTKIALVAQTHTLIKNRKSKSLDSS